MNVITKTLGAIATILLCVPAGVNASWSAAGNYEPSTPYDDATWMWAGPAEVGESRVYFNVVTQLAPAGVAGVSPNAALVQTRVETPTNEYHYAFFGVWTDCNGDGYVGMAEQAVREYASQLLLDDTVCPAFTGPTDAWTAGANNYNGWVSEFITIARPADPEDLDDLRVYVDAEAGVWGDYGKPDEKATFRSCALAPQPRGTYQSTGGALNYAECRFQQNGFAGLKNFNDAMETIGDPLGLAGTDPEEEDWRTTGLDVANPAGSEDSQYSAAQVADCSADPLLHTGDTLNSTDPGVAAEIYALDEEFVGANLDSTTVPALDPQPGNTAEPNAPGTLNETSEAFFGDCDTSNDAGHDFYGNDKFGTGLPFYVGEEDFNGVSPKNKHESDWNFNYADLARGDGVDDVALPVFDGASGMAGDGGVGFTGANAETAWYSPSVYASKLGPRSIRADLGNGDVGISRAWWMSFYAHVGEATTLRFLTPGGQAEYGAWQCEGVDSGIAEHSGWNCDVTTWYKNQDGSTYPEAFRFARPGDLYQLRDVDCYDGGIGAAGIGIEPAFYGNEPCP